MKFETKVSETINMTTTKYQLWSLMSDELEIWEMFFYLKKQVKNLVAYHYGYLKRKGRIHIKKK